MAGRMEGDVDAIEPHRLAIADRLRRAGKILAVAQPHQVERFLRRQHGAMAGPRMVGMAMRDQRLVDTPGRIDIEAAPLAAHASRRRHQNVFRSHPCQIGRDVRAFAFAWPAAVLGDRAAVRLLRRSRRRPALQICARLCRARRFCRCRGRVDAGAGSLRPALRPPGLRSPPSASGWATVPAPSRPSSGRAMPTRTTTMAPGCTWSASGSPKRCRR